MSNYDQTAIQNLLQSDAGSDSNYQTLERANSSSQLASQAKRNAKSPQPAIATSPVSQEGALGAALLKGTGSSPQRKSRRDGNTSQSLSPAPRKLDTSPFGRGVIKAKGRSEYSMMAPIREDPLSVNGGTSRSTDNKDEKLGRFHKIETLSASFIRESQQSMPSAGQRTAVKSNDGSINKVSWQPPPEIKETIIEASLDDEAGVPMKVTHRVHRIQKKRKRPKPASIAAPLPPPIVEEAQAVGTPKFKPAPIIVKEEKLQEKMQVAPIVIETKPEPDQGMFRDLEVSKHTILRGIRKADYDAIMKMGLLTKTDVAEVNIDGGFTMPSMPQPVFVAETKPGFQVIEQASKIAGVSQAGRVTEPAGKTRDKNPPFVQDGYVSCGSEAGSGMSQDTITDSVLDLRARVAEKRTRALRRLRGMMNIIKVWKLSVKKPIVARFQKTVRRLIYGLRLQQHMISNRRYPNISNPRARKAIYRLMMLVRMKLRNTSAMGWREKWNRARLRVRGMIKIQRVITRERKERIDAMYEPDEAQSEEYYEENDEVFQLDQIDEYPKTDPLQAMKNKSGLTGQLRVSALAANKNHSSILPTVHRASMLSQGAKSVRSVLKSVAGSQMSKRSMMSVKSVVSAEIATQTNQVFSMPSSQPLSGAPTKIAGNYARQYTNGQVADALVEQAGKSIQGGKYAGIHQMSEEQKFSTAFSAAIGEAEKQTKFQTGEPRSRIVQVSTREEHEKQAATLSVFIKQLSQEFMAEYPYLTPDLRQKQNQMRSVNMQGAAGSDYDDVQSQRSSQYYGEVHMARTPKGREVFSGRRSVNGELQVANEQIASQPGVIELKCNNNHSLFATRWTKREATNCQKCKTPITHKKQMITCPVKSCETTLCMDCAGCMNGHPLHRRVLEGNAPLETKNNQCLRCSRDLSKELSVKWCVDCKHAYCPEGCNVRRNLD